MRARDLTAFRSQTQGLKDLKLTSFQCLQTSKSQEAASDGQPREKKQSLALAGPTPILSSYFFLKLADRSDDKAHLHAKETLQ